MSARVPAFDGRHGTPAVRIEHGTLSSGTMPGGSPNRVLVAVTFDRPFTATPTIVVSFGGSTTAPATVVVAATSWTPTGFNFDFSRTNTGTGAIQGSWIAVGI